MNTHILTSDERGFALPAAILAVVVVALLATAGMFVAQQESRTSMATHQGTRAFFLTERAIGEVVETWDNERFTQLPMFGTDFVSGTADGGEWEVEVRRIGSQLYFLNARGEITEGGRYAGATRNLGMVMRVRSIEIDVPGAITTQGDGAATGNSEVNGIDRIPAGWDEFCTDWRDDGAGITTDDGSTASSGGSSTLDGDPDWTTDDTIDDDTFRNFGGLEWDDLVALANHSIPGGTLNQIYPRLTGDGECDRSQGWNWGDGMDPTAPCANYFPVIHVDGNARLEGWGHGQGLLLVEGDLNLAGGFNFFGIIIVQGDLTTSGGGGNYPTVHGGILSRNPDGNTQSFSGFSRMLYSTCAIQRALAGLNNELVQLRPIRHRTWSDVSAISF